MEKPVLSDESIYPDRSVTASALGQSIVQWDTFFEFIHSDHPDFLEEWNYYRDGGRWLLKIKSRKKTVCWVSVVQDAFMVTFYFPDRAWEIISAGSISTGLKEQFKDGKRYGKIRALTIPMKDADSIQNAAELIRIRLQV